ncbi:MAG: response regulator transcription factor [Magnetococcales bacterium]|nr:response regulator transcription factor [Magnetococcales bacterium]
MIKIIIIDDHGVIRDGLKSLIEPETDLCVVGEAGSGGQGLAMIASLDWDVALLDVNLPDINGLEVLRKVRASGCDRKVLILTMYRDFHLVRRLMQSGASGFIDKSSLAGELLRAIRMVAGGEFFLTDEMRCHFADTFSPKPSGPLHDRLSAQEFTILLLISRGYTVSRIAEELQLSPSTVTTYRRRIKEKLGIEGSTADLVRYAMENALSL